MTETAEKPRLSPAAAEELRQVYDRMREQINTENGFYNQRIVWLISMNAFLFATTGLILQAKFNEGLASLNGPLTFGAQVQDIVDGFLILFSLVGLFISAIGGRLIKNTNIVRAYIQARWDAYIGKLGDVADLDGYLSVEGGSGKSVKHWLLSSGNIPHIFTLTWVILLTAVVSLFLNRHIFLFGL